VSAQWIAGLNPAMTVERTSGKNCAAALAPQEGGWPMLPFSGVFPRFTCRSPDERSARTTASPPLTLQHVAQFGEIGAGTQNNLSHHG
jgi:hypothetical protein